MFGKEAKRILIIKQGAFGDLVQASGVFKDIRVHFPDAELTLLTASRFGDLMARCPYIDTLLFDDRAPLWRIARHHRLFKQIDASQFDLIIDLQNSDRTRLYRRWLSKPDWLARTGKLVSTSGLSGLALLLKQAGIATQYSLQPVVSWMADDITDLLAAHQLKKNYIVLIPGCSAKHPEKRWPYYAELAQYCIEAGFEVVKIIGPEELELAEQIPGHNLAEGRGMLSWFELAGVLKQASFVVGNDTGPSHVASCLNQAGLVLFGNSSCAISAEITRGDFHTKQVDDLSQLSVDVVFQNMQTLLSDKHA